MKVLKIQSVLDKMGCSKTHLEDLIEQGLFPEPAKVSAVKPVKESRSFEPRVRQWLDSEVDLMIGARMAGKHQDDIRKLVEKIVEARKVKFEQLALEFDK